MASLMDENVRSNEEEIRHFPCGTNPLPIRTRAEILPEGGQMLPQTRDRLGGVIA